MKRWFKDQAMTAWLKVLAMALLLVANACVSAGTQAIKDPGVISKIEAGKSTRADVRALLGYPLAATHKDQGLGEVTWHYYYATAYPNASAFIPEVNAFTRNLNETTRVLSVTFNQNGTVKSLKQEEIPLPAQQIDLKGKNS
ncbi:MAG: outer membrane protein assembly factor BamE [Deltaproteobacteria bacterium]|jgi:outer membrane protein assembly factor BamE (lipoprotein component of BamABCDE complex)